MKGVKPKMTKLYDGRNVATRPIPVYHDTADDRAIASAAAEQKPKTEAVNWPTGPRPAGTAAVTGTQISGATKVNGGVYNPSSGLSETI
jgi:hypothetical protein